MRICSQNRKEHQNHGTVAEKRPVQMRNTYRPEKLSLLWKKCLQVRQRLPEGKVPDLESQAEWYLWLKYAF